MEDESVCPCEDLCTDYYDGCHEVHTRITTQNNQDEKNIFSFGGSAVHYAVR